MNKTKHTPEEILSKVNSIIFGFLPEDVHISYTHDIVNDERLYKLTDKKTKEQLFTIHHKGVDEFIQLRKSSEAEPITIDYSPTPSVWTSYIENAMEDILGKESEYLKYHQGMMGNNPLNKLFGVLEDRQLHYWYVSEFNGDYKYGVSLVRCLRSDVQTLTHEFVWNRGQHYYNYMRCAGYERKIIEKFNDGDESLQIAFDIAYVIAEYGKKDSVSGFLHSSYTHSDTKAHVEWLDDVTKSSDDPDGYRVFLYSVGYEKEKFFRTEEDASSIDAEVEVRYSSENRNDAYNTNDYENYFTFLNNYLPTQDTSLYKEVCALLGYCYLSNTHIEFNWDGIGLVFTMYVNDGIIRLRYIDYPKAIHKTFEWVVERYDSKESTIKVDVSPSIDNFFYPY